MAADELVGLSPAAADRPPRGAGEERGSDAGSRAVLPSEAGTHRRDDDTNVVLVQSEGSRELYPGRERRLRRRPDGDSVGRPRREGRASLERNVGDVRRGVRGLDPDVAAFEGRLDVAGRLVDGRIPVFTGSYMK